MIRRTPRATPTDTLFPYATLCRSRRPSGSRALTARRLLGTEARAGGNVVSVTGDGEARPISSAMAWRAAMRLPVSGWVENRLRSEEHTSELQSLMRTSYAVFCLKKKRIQSNIQQHQTTLMHT